MTLLTRATSLAKEAHKGQTRKYSGVPYIVHPARVAGRTMLLQGATERTIAIAFLHDVIEDTDVTFEQLINEFGSVVAQGVNALTNQSKGYGHKRAVRKEMDLEHIAQAPSIIRQIKLLDRIDNLNDMRGSDNDFERLYLQESTALNKRIGHSNVVLSAELRGIIVTRMADLNLEDQYDE